MVVVGHPWVILIATFTVAWVTPPQTWDSLTYHLSRIAHWSQNQSVGHYISGIERQNSMSIGAELLVLNLYVLARGDWLANFPQWLAMLGSLLGVSHAAGLLGAKHFGQLLAACFAATLPMGIVQASSTATDYLTTFWMVCTAVEVLNYHQQDKRASLFFASLAAGLALLTKPIAIPYILPFAVWMAVLLLRRHGGRTGVKWIAAAVMVVGTINAGYLVRNLVTYGHIANPADLAYHSNQMRNLPGWVSILARNAGMHAGLPEAHGWNENIFKVVLRIHMLLGLGLEDPETTLVGYFQVLPPSTQEDFATNPYHAYLIIGLSILIIPLRRRLPARLLLYAACVTLGFIFSALYTSGRSSERASTCCSSCYSPPQRG
jgi:4-amino-4-deoxy-L-arabinose transferase-like glycosyltransferase